MPQPWISFGGLTLSLLLALPALAQDKKDDKSDDKPAAQKSVDQKPAADPYNIPQGKPLELMEFIQKIIRNMPQDEEPRKKARAAMLKAAEKMLAAEPNDKELDFAVDVKMRSLDTAKDIKAFSEVLKKQGRDKQWRTARNYSLQIGMYDAINSGKLDRQKKQIAEVMSYFKEVPPQHADLSLAIMIGQAAELQGDNAYALDTYRNLSKIFGSSKEGELADFGKRLEGVVRRLSLLGKKMQFEGKLLSGEDFDFSKYKDKTVLIDFWASWRQPCLTDLPKLKKAYTLFHDQGFEIVGFGCDYRREDVERFVTENNIPWATVFGDKGPSRTVEFYGILGIPSMILIGKDGNVTDLNVNIEGLDKQLEKLLAPAKEKKDKK